MEQKDRFVPVTYRFGLFLLTLAVFLLGIYLPVQADPPTGTFYYPPGNVPPGPPPNYNQVDTSFFMGEPPIPLPPPDSGGIYIWVDSDGHWNVANHIYSPGNSLEQFHGSVLAMLDSPPAPGVNVFATNFELWNDPNDPECVYCYKQNDRWGWYQWSENLYEIWWDVSTREWSQEQGDPNDFMKIMIVGCAIDFNVWSSGHGNPFGTDQIFLGSSMTRLSDVPGFTDTYPGIEDPYQSQAGDRPETDPNITVFTPIEGIGNSYNLDGIINLGQAYPCGPIGGQVYGDRFGESFVYEGNGIQFSSSCLTDPCYFNNPPVAGSPSDSTMHVCELSSICIPGFTYSDPDGNLLYVEITGGTLDGETVCFDPVDGINTITLICIDDCGAADTAVTIVNVNLNLPPQIDCPPDITIDCASSTDPEFTGYPSVSDDHDPNPQFTYSDDIESNVITRTWTATDDCGSSSQCSQIITLEDSTSPTLTCPENMTLQCVTEIPTADIDLIDVSDDCDPNPVVTFMGDVSDGNSCPEIITRTYRATDNAGNFAECEQIFTIMDTTPPGITCPGNIAISCSDPTDPDFTGYPDVSDNCDGEPAVGFSDQQDDLVITRTWTVTDGCGNSNECTQIITINENQPPVVECPTEYVTVITLELTEICFTDIPVYDPDNEIATIEVNGVIMDGNDICFVPEDWGINTVTIICTDECGASTECSFTAIVGACIFLAGDANADRNVNVIDVIDMLNHLSEISDLPEEGECDCRPNVPYMPFFGGADANGSCAFNVADVVYLFDILKGGGNTISFCPQCPPTEGWLPPLDGNIVKPPALKADGGSANTD